MFALAKSVVAANVILPFLATVAVVLRVVARRKTKVGLKADDYVIFFALLLTLGVCITGIWGGATQLFGKPLFNMTFAEYALYQKIIRVDALLVYLCFGVVKMSILLFYKRVFPLRKFKIMVYVVMGMVIAFSFSMVICQIFSQKPYDKGWDLPPDQRALTDYHPSFDFTVFLTATASVNLFLDILILFLPVPMISELQTSQSKRASLIVIFGTGAFCIVASAVRLYYCVRAYQVVHDITQFAKTSEMACLNDLWAHIEICGSVIAACLPTLAPLYKGSDPNTTTIASFFDRCFAKLGCMQHHTTTTRSGTNTSTFRKSSGMHSLPSRPASTEYMPMIQSPRFSSSTTIAHNSALRPLPPIITGDVWSKDQTITKSHVIYVEKEYDVRRQDQI